MANFGPDLPIESGFLVAGEWIGSGERVPIHSPYDGREIGLTFLASRKHLEAAIRAAVKSAAEVRRMPSSQRKEILL